MSEGTKKVAAITAPFPGAKRPLQEGAKLGWWDYVELGEKPVDIPIHAEVFIFGAFHPVYNDIARDIMVWKGKRIVIMWTSSIGEVDLCPPEQEYLPELMRSNSVHKIWFGDPGFAQAYPEKGFHARYPLCVDHVVIPHFWDKEDRVTLMCPSTSKKNILTQLLAVKVLQDKGASFTLDTNVEGYDWVLKDIKHEKHGWLEDEEYKKVIQRAKVNLAVSHCETFNYQVAEAALLGTPSVISPTIPFVMPKVEDVGSIAEISRTLAETLEKHELYAKDCWDGIIGASVARNQHTLKVLEKELDIELA